MHKRSRIARAGFTLAEMLMAVAIIAVLMALTAAAIYRFMDTGPYNATVANLSKVQAALDTQWKTVRDKAMKDSLNGIDPSRLSVADLADPRARDNYVNTRLAQAFPISFAEALTPSVLDNPPQPKAAYPGYETYLRKLLNAMATPFGTLRTTAQRAAPPHVQQAVCLMMILEVGPGNVGLTADKIEGGMVQRLKTDLPDLTTPDPNDKILANGICDGWGRPVLFTRNYQPFVGTAKANQLVLVSIGAIRGQTQPWERVRIDGLPWTPPIPKNTPWPAGTPWTPNSNNHTLTPRDVDARDITDEVITTFKYQP
jgi:prepilin-type N-terminal cleavage/methylation domain-containing protein